MTTSYPVVLAWLAFGYLMLLGIRYVLAARVYLTCAVQEVVACRIERQAINPGELRVLTHLDTEFAAAQFRHLGFGQVTPLITYYGSPTVISVFVNEAIPAYALVQRRLNPEYGGLVEVKVLTGLSTKTVLVTQNVYYEPADLPASLSVEVRPNVNVSDLVQRHKERVAMAGEKTLVAHNDTLEDAVKSFSERLASVRDSFRKRGWIVPTVDSRLDRFTVRGAFGLAHSAIRASRKRVPGTQRWVPIGGEADQSLRVEADVQAVLHIADYPEPAPGANWPLLAVVTVTALISFAAMSFLWNMAVASIILAVIAFHEAGHAVAMRVIGYKDVHVFFVPLLGALTIGRPTATTVRQRLTVLLAGPLPGLWLGVLLLEVDRIVGHVPLLRASALALLLLNGLNLLPITPFDGGRALESLIRPESMWRLVIHAGSVIGLVAAGVAFKDPILAAFGVAWALLLPRQVLSWRLRRSVAETAGDRADRHEVLRTALHRMTIAPFSAWRSPVRQATARAISRLFFESVATASDRRWGLAAYVCSWVPIVIALMRWRK
jgi:Zn-dependent protease